MRSSIFILISFLIGTVGCEKKEDKTRITADDQMSAESLAITGEQLVAPHTYMLADQVFDMALAKDPSNQRAQFYKAFLLPFMSYKGILTRVKPAVRQFGDIAAHEKSIAKFYPNSPLKSWLLDGKEDIATVKDLQDFIVNLRDRFYSLRQFLKERNLEITLNLNPEIFRAEVESEYRNSCVVIENTPRKLDLECDFSQVMQKKINAADLLVLRHYAAALAVWLETYTSYSVEGSDSLILESKKGNGPKAPSELQAALEKIPTFGKLRNDNRLSRFIELGSDLSAAIDWVMDDQETLCKKGRPDDNNRKGFLFKHGLCLPGTDSNRKQLALLNAALAGTVTVEAKRADGTLKNTKINYLAWNRNPVQDLRSIAPASYNNCGKVSSLRDNTLGGIYPDGDFGDFLDVRCP